jgi:hypothetical protein
MPNTILKRWNGSAFEELYPKTVTSQIAASGTPSSSTFLRGDGQWAVNVIAGSTYPGAYSVPGGGTNTGAIIYGDFYGWHTRSIGTTGQVLTVSGGVPVWATPAAGGSFLPLAGGTLTGQLNMSGNNLMVFGPNTGWSKYLSIGGNANSGDVNTASIGTTNGNLHIDAATNSGTYLNFYKGTSGLIFGNGAGTIVAWMGPDGDLWKGSADNSGSQYWHAGNDGSGSGLDADTTDGLHIWNGTQAQYNAITTKDVNTLYFIE